MTNGESEQQAAVHPLVTWLETLDKHASTQWSELSANEAAIAPMAHAWRAWFASQAMATPMQIDAATAALRDLTKLERGGVGTRGGLGADYPSGLLAVLRHGWALAARSLTVQAATLGPAYATSDFEELAQAIETCDSPAFAPTPSKIVLEIGGFRLRRLSSSSSSAVSESDEPIVVIAPLVNRWYVLDFAEGESFLGMLTSTLGRPVYLVEWLPPSDVSEDERSFGELASGPLKAMLDHVRTEHRVSTVALAGYSTGGVLATLLAARYPEHVGRLATVCAPVRFGEDANAGAFARWLSARHLDVEQVTSTYGRAPSWLAHLPFWWLKPSIKIEKLAQLCRRFRSEGYVRRFLANEIWSHDNVDLTAGAFRSWIGELFQRDALARGDVVVGGERVTLGAITCPVLVIAGEHDAIITPPTAEALGELVGSSWRRTMRLRATHVGAVTSARSLREMAPQFAEWVLASRNEREVSS